MTDADRGEGVDWRRLALHALLGLRLLGIRIEMVPGVTPEVVKQVDDYDRLGQ